MALYPRKVSGQRLQTDAGALTTVSERFVAHYTPAANPAATSNTAVHAAVTLTASPQTVTTGITNPDVPRALIAKGNQAGVAGDVVITGTNFKGDVITETIALNGANAVSGNKAFKTVTSIALPVEVNAGTDTVSIGYNDKLGFPHKLTRNTVQNTYLGNALEGTPPTVAVSSSALESNTFDLNSALNGTQVDIYYFV